MCIKIFKNKKEFKYNPLEDFEQQVCGSTKIIINYDPKDSAIKPFVEKIDLYSKTGKNIEAEIIVMHNNYVPGMKIKKTIKKNMASILLNKVIESMVISYHNTKNKLEDIKNHMDGLNAEKK